MDELHNATRRVKIRFIVPPLAFIHQPRLYTKGVTIQTRNMRRRSGMIGEAKDFTAANRVNRGAICNTID